MIEVWTIYQHGPESFEVRKHYGAGATTVFARQTHTAGSLAEARRRLPTAFTLRRFKRSAHDDPTIVESWLTLGAVAALKARSREGRPAPTT